MRIQSFPFYVNNITFELVIELVRTSGTDEEDAPEGVEFCSLCGLLDTGTVV